jgi:putative transcriptional regulator
VSGRESGLGKLVFPFHFRVLGFIDMAYLARRSSAEKLYLDGKVLIAMPGMEDKRFARSVVYICAHSADGAMGIMINQIAPQISIHDLLVQLDVIPDRPAIRLPGSVARLKVHRGGPVETGRGFVLHSSDYFIDNATLPIDENVSLTATLEILKAMAAGAGPQNALLALGYAGWEAGQLDREIQMNGWLHLPAPPDFIFDPYAPGKYDRALALLGIEPSRLSTQAGHA